MTRTSSKRNKLFILSFFLVILVIANLWLFLPRFIRTQQLLTPPKLKTEVVALQDVAHRASQLLVQTTNPTTASVQLQALQQRADDAVIVLQRSEHQLALGELVHQSLALAQIISFTLHDISFDLADPLRVAQTSQVLSQASTTAQTLSEQIPDQ